MNLSFQGLRNQYVPEYFQWISDEHQSDYLTASSNGSIEYMWIRMGNQQSSMIRCCIHQWFLRWYVRHNVYEVSDRKEVRYVSYYSCFLSICIWVQSHIHHPDHTVSWFAYDDHTASYLIHRQDREVYLHYSLLKTPGLSVSNSSLCDIIYMVFYQSSGDVLIGQN